MLVLFIRAYSIYNFLVFIYLFSICVRTGINDAKEIFDRHAIATITKKTLQITWKFLAE